MFQISSPSKQKYSATIELLPSGRHGRAPVPGFVDAAQLDRRIVDIDPGLVGDLRLVDHQVDGDQVAVTQSVRCLDHLRRRLRPHGQHQFRERHAGTEILDLQVYSAIRGFDVERSDVAAIVIDAATRECIRTSLPCFSTSSASRSLMRPMPSRGYRNLSISVATLPFFCGKERVLDRDSQRQPLDPLRRPLGLDLVAVDAPDLLGVILEEEFEELAGRTRC